MGDLGPECGRSLRILFTNNTLDLRAGSELFVFDLAVALRRRGHQPIAFSTVLGAVAEQLRSAAVPVIDDLSLLTVTPDVIHGQHHLELATALLHFPHVPAIHVCHGWLPWEEAPLRFPTIRKYVAVSDLTRERLLTSGIPTQSIETAYNFVDTERYKLRDGRPGSLKTAAVFGNYLSSKHPHYLNILAACRQLRFESVDLLGGTAGSPIPNPEEVLPNYDVVFAAGRCALEALACGCAVIIADHHGLGAWVTTDNLERFRRGNFGIAVTSGNELTRERVVAELLRIAPGEAEAVTSKIRATASLASYVETWERIYIDAIAASNASISPDALTLAASRYLMTLNPVIKARPAVKLGRPRASRFGANLRAAWRHLRHSRKRKFSRVNHMPRRQPAPPGARPTKFTTKLRALARYPFSPKRRRAYREQLRSSTGHEMHRGQSN